MFYPARWLFSLLLMSVAQLLIVASPAAADSPPDLLAGQSWTLITPSTETAQMETVPATDGPDGMEPHPNPPLGKGRGQEFELRVTVAKPVDPYYLVQVTATLAAVPKAGDQLRYSFWARAGGNNTMRAVIETAGAPWIGVVQQAITLTPSWKHYEIADTVSGDYGQPMAARLQVGGMAGTIEFAGMKAEDLGPTPAFADAQAAVTPAAIRDRIRRYRMGSLTVRVVDAHGRPVPHAHVSVRMQRHAFLFGCNFFGLKPDDNSADQLAYRNQFAALFNYATLPFYWGAFETTQGKPDFPRLDAMINWCHANHITVKAHPLVWHQVYPNWAPADPDRLIPLLHARIQSIVGRERNRVACFDVVNEASNGASYLPANGETRWLQRDGAPSVVETALGWARDAEGDAHDTLIYNDYDTGPANLALITRMQQDGKLPDAIGIQSHMHGGAWPLAHVWIVCQTFAQFHRPIHFTETTVLSGPMRTIDFKGPDATDWNTTPDGEKAQADYVAQFYSLLFSHPSLRAITWWDFSDKGSWLGAPSGLLRKDMTPKPVYDRLMQLIHHDWWTNVDGRTGPQGAYVTRAFYGDYVVTVDNGHGGHTTQNFAFPEGCGASTVKVVVGE